MLARINQARGHVPDEVIPIAQRREAIHRMMDQRAAAVVAAPPEIDRHDRAVPVDGGEIVVRIYRPPAAGPSLPGHVYVHGGGWWLGTLDHRDRVCASRAVNVGCVVVSVAHRLAPEHRYPVPAEDVFAALQWVAAHAPDLGVDPMRISIGGDSSGANLAAAATLMSRDRGCPALVAQTLEIPALDLTMSQPSIEDSATGYVLTRDELTDNIDLYCAPDERSQPYASPALAVDLAGLPPALIMTAEYDVLRDDGAMYARRLSGAGVRAEVICWAGHVHGSHEMTAMVPSAQDWQARVESFLREANQS
jgi:acetyl esterase